jgi:hypothetical protein
LRTISRLPLEVGQSFATAQYLTGGLDALDAAILRPPRSTEQMLHPDLYEAREEPVILPPLAPDLGRQWALTYTDTLGEALMRVVLTEWSYDQTASESTDGWGGDVLQAWHTADGARVVLWQTAWDSEKAAATFQIALLRALPAAVLEGPIEPTPRPESLPGGRWWAGPKGAAFIERATDRVWLAWGSDADAVRAVAASAYPAAPEE